MLEANQVAEADLYRPDGGMAALEGCLPNA
jgi:hypothetical protein